MIFYSLLNVVQVSSMFKVFFSYTVPSSFSRHGHVTTARWSVVNSLVLVQYSLLNVMQFLSKFILVCI